MITIISVPLIDPNSCRQVAAHLRLPFSGDTANMVENVDTWGGRQILCYTLLATIETSELKRTLVRHCKRLGCPTLDVFSPAGEPCFMFVGTLKEIVSLTITWSSATETRRYGNQLYMIFKMLTLQKHFPMTKKTEDGFTFE